ncbi:hypothetical protein L195_g031005 [Trifolium pratense]|uniref:Uncharacterized protein n=1 Tax=Trifolium pratense TaxID=57577 RepID=A0A2K3L974_TRIPR|nr:hypothetical protein L195_g031005 [Trifolium pratense]
MWVYILQAPLVGTWAPLVGYHRLHACSFGITDLTVLNTSLELSVTGEGAMSNHAGYQPHDTIECSSRSSVKVKGRRYSVTKARMNHFSF